MISESPIIQKGQHRKYRILEQKHKSTVVSDLVNNHIYPCRRLHIPDGKEVLLYIKKVENTGEADKIWFDYSLLNDYKEGETLEFDVVAKTETGYTVENNPNKQLFLPASLSAGLNDMKRLRLTIQKIDIEENKLFFAPVEKSMINKYDSISEGLRVGESYNFKVKGYKEVNDSLTILMLEKDGVNYTVKAFDFQKGPGCTEYIRCIVRDIGQDKIHLQQDKYALFNQLYEEGKKYRFTVLSLEQDEYSKYYNLEDFYRIHHRVYYTGYFHKKFESLRPGKSIELLLKRIDKKGYLLLSFISDDLSTRFFSAEEVFGAIGITDLNTYFFDLKDEFDQSPEEKTRINPVEDHQNGENHWLFSYLQFISNYSLQLINNKKIEDAKKYLSIYIDIEKWILEGSDFLNYFNPEKKTQIILKAKYSIQKSMIKLQACELLESEKAKAFIDKTISSLTKSGRLKMDTISMFKEILAITNVLFTWEIDETINVISLLIKNDLLDSYESGVYRNILESRIIQEKKQLNQVLNIENTGKAVNSKILDNILNIHLLQILLDEKSDKKEYAVIDSANFLRYLSLKTSNIKDKRELLKNSLYYIFSSLSIKASLSDLNTFPKKFSVRKYKGYNISESGRQFYVNNGAIYKGVSGWHLFSSPRLGYNRMAKELNFSNIATFYNGLFNISTKTIFNLPLTGLPSFRDYITNWAKYYQNTQDIIAANKPVLFPNPGERAEVVVKCLHKENCQLLFLKLTGNQFKGEGVLHVSELLSVNLNSLEDLFYPDEKLIIRVKESEQQLSFSLKQDIWEVTRHLYTPGEYTDAQVVSVNDELCFAITGQGAPCVFRMPKSKNTGRGETCRLRIINNREDKMSYYCEYHSHTENKVDAKSVLRQLLRKYFIINETTNDQHNTKITETMIVTVILTLEALVFLEENVISKLEGLYLLKLICSISKNSMSYYFEEHIKHLNTMLEFLEFNENTVFEKIDYMNDQTLEVYNRLNNLNDDLVLLSYYNNTEAIDKLKTENIYTTNEKKELQELILAHNILKKYCSNKARILSSSKDLINKFLLKGKLHSFENMSLPKHEYDPFSTSDTTEHESNLGREGEFREFKTSFIFFAGTAAADIEKQSSVIMKTICGFLNSKGGSLFIGVNDEGHITGLHDDYSTLPGQGCADAYERLIRKYIVRSFSKDINGQIELKFHECNQKEYLEITIPAGNRPVSFKEEFYQRQGNETRLLKGNDLLLFLHRRLFMELKPEQKNQLDLDKSPAVVAEKNNPVVKVQEKKVEENIIAYFSLFLNGSYIITRSRPNTRNIKTILPVRKSDENGFLLQGYDNGCVNKVKIRSILEKRFGFEYKNGVSAESNLIILTIIPEEALLRIEAKKDNIEYVKLYHTIHITVHDQLNLRGNKVLPNETDSLMGYSILKNIYSQSLSRLLYESSQSLGKPKNHPNYRHEFEILATIEERDK